MGKSFYFICLYIFYFKSIIIISLSPYHDVLLQLKKLKVITTEEFLLTFIDDFKQIEIKYEHFMNNIDSNQSLAIIEDIIEKIEEMIANEVKYVKLQYFTFDLYILFRLSTVSILLLNINRS